MTGSYRRAVFRRQHFYSYSFIVKTENTLTLRKKNTEKNLNQHIYNLNKGSNAKTETLNSKVR